MNSSFIHHSLQKDPLSTYYVGGPVLPKDTPGTKAKKIPAVLVFEKRRLGAPYWMAGEDYNFNKVRR